MPATNLKPSLHGWPFANFGKFGNCGGMCWAVLDRTMRVRRSSGQHLNQNPAIIFIQKSKADRSTH
jgi:hypothetical protein